MSEYDVLVVGGGMVGASLACALGGAGIRVGVIEAVPFRSDSQPSYDDRVIALSHGSSRILRAMGVWPGLEKEGITPIERIHVSDRGRFGAARLDCAEERVEALGYVVESRVFGRVMGPLLEKQETVELFCPARLKAFDLSARRARVLIEHEGEVRDLRARLLVAADGGQSVVRERQGIKLWRAGYGQTAVIANVTPERPHRNVAYERFTDTGPLALLPMTEGRCSLVWTARDEEVPGLLKLNETAFLRRLQERFGYRLGRFQTIGRRVAYPLTLMHVRERVRQRLAIVGNAAHLLHPVAGQGFNLGLRDVAVLAETLHEARRNGEDPGDLTVLKRYSDARRGDYLRTTSFTDGLVRTFSNNFFPLAVARDAGLVALDILPPLKHLLARQAMGHLGRLSRLERGLPL